MPDTESFVRYSDAPEHQEALWSHLTDKEAEGYILIAHRVEGDRVFIRKVRTGDEISFPIDVFENFDYDLVKWAPIDGAFI